MHRGASKRRGRAGLRALLLTLALIALRGGVAQAENPVGLLYRSPGISPPGANNFACKPTAAHPDPVVLVHGANRAGIQADRPRTFEPWHDAGGDGPRRPVRRLPGLLGAGCRVVLSDEAERRGPDAWAGLHTVIETNHDEVVTPFQSAFLPAEDGRVTNVLLQDDCPADLSEHIALTDDPVAIQWVLNALGRTGPADPSFRPDCTGLARLGGAG